MVFPSFKMSSRTSQSNKTSVVDENEEGKAEIVAKKVPVINHTPILSYKPEIFNAVDKSQENDTIKVEIRAPHTPTHRKVIKMRIEKADITTSKGVTFSPEEGKEAKDYVFNLEKKTGSDTQWGFPEREVKPIIKGKKVNKIMKEALYGVKLKVDNKLGFDPFKVYNFGEPGCGTWRGVVQDFAKIREYHFKNGTLFEDPIFPANATSISYSGKLPKCYWARPKEIMPDAKLFIGGFSRFDVNQGNLGDCWLLASIGTLTQRHNLFLQVVPLDQSFMDKYAGIFHFRFWQFGRWVDIVIDDRLPVNVKGELLFTRSTSKKEFWPALLEKAYAKLHGSYEALVGGIAAEAMEDFTGGITETYEPENMPPNFFRIMKRAFAIGSLITMTISGKEGMSNEHVTEMGLVEGHAYTLTRVLQTKIKTINNKSMDVELVRLRNPWGPSGVEWNGPWNERSAEWNLVTNQEKERVGLNFDHDGEFWMSYSDFLANASYVDICNLSPEASKCSRKWEVVLFEGEWVKGLTAGGCPNYDKTFDRNPQYLITLDEPDTKNSNICTIVVSLMQKNRRGSIDMGKSEHDIGFVIYPIADPKTAPKPLNRKYLYSTKFEEFCDYEAIRSVSKRFELPMGTYCIIPSTFEPDECGEFLLRVFSERKMLEIKQYEQEVGIYKKEGRICMCSPIDVHLSLNSMEKNVGNITKPPSQVKQVLGTEKKTGQDDLGHKSRHPEPPKVIKVIREQSEIKADSVVEAAEEEDKQSKQSSTLSEQVYKEVNIARIISNDPVVQEEIETQFLKLSGDDEEINWEDLRKLLDIAFKSYPNYKTFNIDLCRSLVALYDENQSGKLFFEEFARLCRDVGTWTAVFEEHANNNVDPETATTVLSSEELRSFLEEAGFTINNHILNLIYHRYGNGEDGFEYEDVLMCIVRIKNMIAGYAVRRIVDSEISEFSIEDFMNLVMYS